MPYHNWKKALHPTQLPTPHNLLSTCTAFHLESNICSNVLLSLLRKFSFSRTRPAIQETVWKNEQKRAECKHSEQQNLIKPPDEQISSRGCFLQKASPHIQEIN